MKHGQINSSNIFHNLFGFHVIKHVDHQNITSQIIYKISTILFSGNFIHTIPELDSVL